MLTHLSLFAGIEGFGLAGRWLGWNLVASVEIDKYCQQTIKKNFPDTTIHADVRTTDFTIYRYRIDIVTGGFPCQSFSLAGKGAMDLTLWKEMLRAIREVQPRWVVAENVYGLIARKKGVALETVCTDLENEGFTVFPPVVIPAAGVGAPHRRDRVWIIAYANGNGHKCVHRYQQDRRAAKQSSRNEEKRQRLRDDVRRDGAKKNATNPTCQRLEICDWRNDTGEIAFAADFIGFPTQPPVCRRNDGLPSRVEQIKQFGNAIVPQVFFEIGDSINEMGELLKKLP